MVMLENFVWRGYFSPLFLSRSPSPSSISIENYWRWKLYATSCDHKIIRSEFCWINKSQKINFLKMNSTFWFYKKREIPWEEFFSWSTKLTQCLFSNLDLNGHFWERTRTRYKKRRLMVKVGIIKAIKTSNLEIRVQNFWTLNNQWSN